MAARKQIWDIVNRGSVIASALITAALVLLFCFAAAEENPSPADGPLLQLSVTDVTLHKGKTLAVRVTVQNMPANTKAAKYEWDSSDPEVAECRNSTIRASGGGEAVLGCTVTLTDGTALRAECRVTVVVPVSGLKSENRNLTVMKGDVFSPEITVLPADATDPSFRFASADEGIVRVREDGTLEAAGTGKTTVTASAAENPNLQVRIAVTVTRRIGKTDRELTFLGIPWESDHETCMTLLKEKGFISEQAQSRSNHSSSVWHWPENDLLFSRTSSWRALPVMFSDRRTGAERVSLDPQKTIGGYMPQTATLIYLNGIGPDGKIDPDATRLIGAYFHYDNRHEEGSEIFLGLLDRLEAEYGEFNRYMEKDIPRYYSELYRKVRDGMKDARTYGIEDTGKGLYLGEYLICTIYGQGGTGIMLSMDMNESVTLFYGRTDAEALIRELEEALDTEQLVPEDAGV